jgi:hypothetical protein
MIKTNGTNVWNDRKVPTILSYLAQQFKNGVMLKFRQANRTAGDDKGLLEQGVLTGSDVTMDSSGDSPVLWLFEMTFSDQRRPPGWNGEQFFYPTLVLPVKSPILVFNKS